MVKKRAFIGGPVQGFELDQGYRDDLHEMLHGLDYEVLDPWKREALSFNYGDGKTTSQDLHRVISGDLEGIDSCDLFVAYLPWLSAGTCMELFYAKRAGKQTAVISTLESPSPWLVYHSDIYVRSMKDLEAKLKDMTHNE